MRILGRLYFQDDRVFLDAEPHVMKRARVLFDSAQSHWFRGEYTHNPIHFTKNNQTAKDLEWLMVRYPMKVSDDVREWIDSGARRYDKIASELLNLGNDPSFRASDRALKLALPLRPYQVQFKNMADKVKRMLLGDKIGVGKTAGAIGTIIEPEARPAIIVVPTHLCTQWDRELKRFLPEIKTHVIRTFKNYDLPDVDAIITSYNRLAPWQDVLLGKERTFKTVIFDEVHELRHTGTGKREISALLSKEAEQCFGLSGTPIYNNGGEIWSVMDVISPKCLGTSDEFEKEWCSWGRVNEPAILHNYLKEMGLMLRRSPEDVGLEAGQAYKHIYTLDADLETLKAVQDVAKVLALSVLSGDINESSESARQLDWKLRHATGVAKAKSTAEFVKMLCEQGEKVMLVGWHRDVYDIWLEQLKQYNPVMYTGSESPAQKEKAVKEFMEGNAQIFIISLRSGAGLDGLQRVANHVVFGELDWSPHVMDQVVGRLDRQGQTKPVQAFYLTIADGADPFMLSVLGEKRSQHDGLIEGKSGDIEIKEPALNFDRVKEMAKAYLQKIGEPIPESNLDDNANTIISALKSLKISFQDETEMQQSVYGILPELLKGFTIEREVKVSARSRLDFLISKDSDRIAIECKINALDRQAVYRQLRKYAKEANITRLILYAPWTGVKDFSVDGIPVNVVDFNLNAI